MKKIFVVLLSLFLLCNTVAFAWDTGGFQWRITKHASSVFDGATGSAHGDKDAANTYTIFTVTGDVIISKLWGIVNTTLTEAGATAAIRVGVTGGVLSKLLPDPTTGATDLVDGDVWIDAGTESSIDASPAAPPSLGAYINDGADIVETTTTQDITGGQIDYYIIWAPAEPGASIVEAGTLSQV